MFFSGHINVNTSVAHQWVLQLMIGLTLLFFFFFFNLSSLQSKTVKIFKVLKSSLSKSLRQTAVFSTAPLEHLMMLMVGEKKKLKMNE